MAKVLDLVTVLEAFTSAKTEHFQAASFASKCYEVQYDAAGKAVGTVTALFDLDKKRLVQQPPGEHSFAVFYQMIAGASQAERRTLHLEGASKFPYLNLDKTSGPTDFHDYHSEVDAQRYPNPNPSPSPNPNPNPNPNPDWRSTRSGTACSKTR